MYFRKIQGKKKDQLSNIRDENFKLYKSITSPANHFEKQISTSFKFIANRKIMYKVFHSHAIE